MTSSTLEPQSDDWEQFAFFGIKPVKYKSNGYEGSVNYYWLVREIDVKRLPFYDFWKENALGSTCFADEQNPGKSLIYVHDWEAFCKLFIKTGKHKFNQHID